jgi:hypothetical protein
MMSVNRQIFFEGDEYPFSQSQAVRASFYFFPQKNYTFDWTAF